MKEDLNIIYDHLFLSRAHPSKISIFLSGSSQGGASWCALNLAYSLSLKNKKILLIDGNGALSNIGSFISLSSKIYLENYFRENQTLNQLVIAHKNTNFNLLTATSGSNYLEDITHGRMQIFAEDINIIAQNNNHTIIDLGNELNSQKLNLCNMADNIFMMCSENSSDLVKIFEIIRFLKKKNISTCCHLIINKVDSYEDGYRIYRELSKAASENGFDIPELLGIIRFDTRIRDTIKNKEMLISRYPESEAAQDLQTITKKILLENFYE